ncbi:MAG: UPF0262 family protein [Alphaproteobacteria bacterium]|nr:UPF0262 family protein [Alphaproteobacteria bacterium]
MSAAREQFKIASLIIGESDITISPDAQRDQQTFIYDLLQNNYFKPVDMPAGTFDVSLSVREGRLVWGIKHHETGKEAPQIIQSFGGYRKLLKDYLAIVAAYNDAVRNATPTQVEAIDMGRRGLHNEGADMVQSRLEGKVETDHETARLLFSIITGFYSSSIKSPCI